MVGSGQKSCSSLSAAGCGGCSEFRKLNAADCEHLRESRDAGHGVLIAPNHCRPCDPFVISELARQVGEIPYTMASWHLFMQGRLQAWTLRRAGVFSIYREGMDRAALGCGDGDSRQGCTDR